MNKSRPAAGKERREYLLQKTKFSSFAATFILCYAFWILLTWSFQAEELAMGAVVSIAAAFVTARFFIHENAFHMVQPKRLWALICYVPTFMWELIKANVDMAKRCLTGCKNVNPGIIRVPADLHSLYAQAMLANSITLTPGTMTLDIAKDTETGELFYYIHWIDVTEEDPEKAGEMIKGALERGIRRIWE